MTDELAVSVAGRELDRTGRESFWKSLVLVLVLATVPGLVAIIQSLATGGDITILQQENSELRASLDLLQKELKASRDDIDEFRASLDASQTQLASVQNDANSLQESLGSLRDTVVELDALVAEQKALIKEFNLTTLEGRLQMLGIKADEITSQVGAVGSITERLGILESDARIVRDVYLNSSNNYIRIVDEKGARNGGVAEPNVFVPRDLNKVTSGSVPLENNIFTLEPGRYRIVASAPAGCTEYNVLRLFSVTDNAELLFGEIAYSHATNCFTITRATLSGEFVLAKVHDLRIDHRTTNSRGIDQDFGYQWFPSFRENIYTVVEIFKLPPLT